MTDHADRSDARPRGGAAVADAEDVLTSMDSPALRVRVKSQIRRRMRQIRAALPEDAWSERSSEACRRALALEAVRSARNVAAYSPIRRELDPREVLDAVRRTGGRVALPRVADEGRSLSFHWVGADDALVPGPFGIREPLESATACDPAEVDLVLVPALAVDAEGNRIGWGRGYYDRALPAFGRALCAALVFDFQIIPEVPVTEGDVPLALVVSDRRVLHARAEEPGPGDGGS